MQPRRRHRYAPKTAATPVRAAPAEGTWRVDLDLVGIPTRDPNSDLYGPRQRIREENRGIKAEPCEATLRLADGAVEVLDCAPPFLEGPGKYRVDAGGALRIKLGTAGFARG